MITDDAYVNGYVLAEERIAEYGDADFSQGDEPFDKGWNEAVEKHRSTVK